MKNILFALLVIATSSCNKEHLPKDVPAPVRREISKFSKSALCNDAHVDEYFFQDQNVYLFENGSCGADMITAVVNGEGKSIGGLGGIVGNSTINGESFSTAQFLRTVWQKTP